MANISSEQKNLATIIGFLNPVSAGAVALDFVPKWVIVLLIMVNGAAISRFHYLINPTSPDPVVPTIETEREKE